MSTEDRENRAATYRSGEVLVGIVTRNRYKVVPKAIESALGQRYSRLRVAVLDDGSDDDTPRLRSQYPAVCWLRWEQSRGYLEGRNRLMRDEDAEFYLSLDDDAWFIDNDEIDVAVRTHEKEPKRSGRSIPHS